MTHVRHQDIFATGQAHPRKSCPRRRAQCLLAARVTPEAEGMSRLRLNGESNIVECREIEEQ
jgi:hypothetical protein